mgnify:CR=1 FL=1
MGYQGFFEILIITLISSKNLGGYRIMKHTVMSTNSIWRTIELVSTSISIMSISPFAVGLPSLFFALEFELMVKMFPSSLVANPNTNPRASSHRFFKYWPGTKCTYRISSYSFRGNYSFLDLEIQRSQYIRPKVTVHKGAETIQGRKLFKGGNYMRKYGIFKFSRLMPTAAVRLDQLIVTWS